MSDDLITLYMKYSYFIYTLLCLSVAVLICSLSTDIKARTELLCDSNIDALAFSNEGPGPQGFRQTQAVWCGGGGWIIRVGCCYGMEDCSLVDCSSHSFSCDGNTWIEF